MTEDNDSRDLFPGALEMVILQTRRRAPMHGYALAQVIKRTSDDLLEIEEGSLYPALQRMLKAGWPVAEWACRRATVAFVIYRITSPGRKQLEREASSFKPILKVSRPPTLGRCWWCRSCLPVLRSRRVTFRLGVRPRSIRLWCCAWNRKREPRRVVSQAILPAAGIRAGSALDVQSRPAGWKAGSSQDWLPT
jgi:PadR family transcriptional regulator PadR